MTPFFAHQILSDSHISLSSQSMLILSWTGHSIRNSQAQRVWSDIIFLNFENKIFDKLKNTQSIFQFTLFMKREQGLLR